MARKPEAPPPDRRMNSDEIRQAIDRLNRRVADVEGFDPSQVTKRWGPEVAALHASITETLSKIFGEGTPRFRLYASAAKLDNGPLSLSRGPDPISFVHEWLNEGKIASLSKLRQAIKGLEEDLAEVGESTSANSAKESDPVPSADIFIVHGRDEKAKIEVARLVERAGLNAVILHEQPNGGRTIIEKFEEHGSSAGFAIVILTPDDVGGLSIEDLAPRARQNVIGEMFWFAGRLGRKRVCALVRGKVEMPSDFAGVGYTDMDDRGAWKAELLREMNQAGYVHMDWGKALS